MTNRGVKPLKITEGIFAELGKDDRGVIFASKVSTHYEWLCSRAALRPVFNSARLADAHFAFCEDEHKHKSPANARDKAEHYFKLSALAAFWLKRLSPVIQVVEDQSGGANRDEGFASVLKEYPSELLAFDFGLTICDFFQPANARVRGEMPPSQKASEEYQYNLDRLCRTLKYKNVSPHSLELVYRSLYRTPRQLLYPG